MTRFATLSNTSAKNAFRSPGRKNGRREAMARRLRGWYARRAVLLCGFSCSNRRDLESFSEVPDARNLSPRAVRLVDADGPGDSGRGPSASHRSSSGSTNLSPRGFRCRRPRRPRHRRRRPCRPPPFPLRRELRSQRSRRPRPRFPPPSRSRRRRRRRPRPRGPSECTSAHTGSARRPTAEARRLGKELALPSTRRRGRTSGRRVCGTASSSASRGRRSEASALRDRLDDRRASRTASS